MPHKDKAQRTAYLRAYQKRRNRERIALAKAHLGGECVRCGSTDDLDFDHIDPATKNYGVTDGTCTNLSMMRFMEEVAKCQLLCKPCHIEKTRAERAA